MVPPTKVAALILMLGHYSANIVPMFIITAAKIAVLFGTLYYLCIFSPNFRFFENIYILLLDRLLGYQELTFYSFQDTE